MTLLAYIGFAGHQMAFDIPGLLILLAVIVLFGVASWQFLWGRRKAAAWISGVALVLVLVQIPRGIMAPARTWPYMLQAIEETNGQQRQRRVEQFRAVWRSRAMTTLDWYFLSRRWRVCHGLWEEQDCPAPPDEGLGIAREILDDLANSAPRGR